MIIILCDSWDHAECCYDIFLSFLEDTMPWGSVINKNDCILRVKMDDGLEYMFGDYHHCEIFEQDPRNDIVSYDEFFEGLLYYDEYCEGTMRTLPR